MRRAIPLALLLAFVLAAAAFAALPQQNGEVDLTIGGDGRIDGGGTSNALTGAIAGVGDVNGDGVSDIAMALSTSTGPAVDIAFQPSSGFYAANGAWPNGQRFLVPGTAGAGSVVSVERAGDVNGDRLADVVIGSSTAGGGNGRAWVVFGHTGNSGPQVDLGAAGEFEGYALTTSENGARFGESVAGAGDVNGDGLADVIVGAPGVNGDRGAAWVFFGKGSKTALDTGSLGSGGYRIAGDGQQTSQFGAFVAGVGDTNGDARADVGVGAPRWDVGDANDAGTVFILHGRATTSDVVAPNLPPNGSDSSGFRIEGPAAGSLTGPVAGAGDVNADGRTDIAVGSPFDTRVTQGAPDPGGSVGVVFGKSGDATAVSLAALGDKGVAYNNSAGENLGAEVRGGFDVNGDGTPDVLAGAPSADVGPKPDAGRVFVLFGRSTPGTVQTSPLPTGAGIRISGTRGRQVGSSAQEGSRIGAARSLGMGDVNGDGRTDALIGAAAASIEGGAAFDPGHAWTVIGFGVPDYQYPGTLSATRNVPYTGAGPSTVKRTGQATFKASPALPAGLVLAEGTGRITGTPTVAGTTTHTLTMTDQAGSVAKVIKIVIAAGKDIDPPVLSKAKLSRTKFRVGKRATAISSAKKKKAGIGTVLRFTTSEAISARISIACTGKLSKARKKPCAKLKKSSSIFRRSLTVGGEAVFTFSGRVGKTPLKPGKYTMTLRAVDLVDLPSNVITLRFTVVK